MPINTYKKRLLRGEILEPGSELVVSIIEALTLNDPEIGTISVGSREVYQVFTTSDSYSSGVALTKPVELSGNNLTGVLTCCVVDGDFPSSGSYDFRNSPMVNGVFFKIKAMDQTTAMDAEKQCRYDSGTQKLRLTGLASSSEITALSDILSAGQKLVVIYYTTPAQISFTGV